MPISLAFKWDSHGQLKNIKNEHFSCFLTNIGGHIIPLLYWKMNHKVCFQSLTNTILWLTSILFQYYIWLHSPLKKGSDFFWQNNTFYCAAEQMVLEIADNKTELTFTLLLGVAQLHNLFATCTNHCTLYSTTRKHWTFAGGKKKEKNQPTDTLLVVSLLCASVPPLESEDDTPVTRGCFRSTVGIQKGWQGWRSVGNWRQPGSVRGAHTKRQGFCGHRRNVRPLTSFKGLFDVQHRLFFPLLPVANTQEGLQGTCANTSCTSNNFHILEYWSISSRNKINMEMDNFRFNLLSSCFSFFHPAGWQAWISCEVTKHKQHES